MLWYSKAFVKASTLTSHKSRIISDDTAWNVCILPFFSIFKIYIERWIVEFRLRNIPNRLLRIAAGKIVRNWGHTHTQHTHKHTHTHVCVSVWRHNAMAWLRHIQNNMSFLNLELDTLSDPLPWASVRWLVQYTLECHWNAIGWPSVHWDTTERPSEYLQGTLEHHWRNLIKTAPHWDATGETLTFTAYTGTPLGGTVIAHTRPDSNS